ncbi:MAG: serine/threonine protein kinase, partial [Bdellovibrionales bacterium]|nr:serine/threonine protein kinase [Bdellovibrionales bacterium]
MKFPMIDKYILFEVIGRGGMGEIFLGKNPGFDGIGKFLAIKRIRPDFTLDPEMVRLFRREAQVAIKLNHSNIGSIYEFGMHEQSFFLVMEFIAGTSLDNIFQRFKAGTIHLGPQDALNIILAIGSALSYAHRFVDPETQEPTPVVHRDVSPHNILVSYEGEVKLIDFGIARMEGGAHHTQTGAVMGKVVYMSPEQMRGERVDHRTDIYALGIILWELLTGTRYYGGQDNSDIRQRLLESKGPKPLPGNIPFKTELDEFLQHMMAPNSTDRYATAEEMVADLQFFYNQNFPGHSQMNLRSMLQEAYLDDIRELKRKLARYSALGSKQSHGETNLDQTAVVTSTVTAITPTLTIQVPANLAQSEEDLRKLVEDVVSSQVTSITSNRHQSRWKKFVKLRYLWILGLLIFTLNIAFNEAYRSQFLSNIALLEDLYQR